MKQTSELLEAGIYDVINVESPKTVGALLKELNIKEPFGILVNGKKVDINHMIKESDEVTILPDIAGG